MNNCPKCGNGKILGPRYSEFGRNPSYARQTLVYMCMQCGYTYETPTRDAQESEARMQSFLNEIAKRKERGEK